MIQVEGKWKVKVYQVSITDKDQIRSFELKLPSDVEQVTSITITTTIQTGQIGKLIFQANDETDIFLTADVLGNELFALDEELTGFNPDDLDAAEGWVTGRVPQKTLVAVNGDASILFCTYKASFPQTFDMKIYVEYQETEKLSIQDND